jgi:O-antigen ligase
VRGIFNYFKGMNNETVKNKLPVLIRWLLVVTFALLPVSTKAANATALLVPLLWLLEGDLKKKWMGVRSNPVAWLPLVYVLWLVVGLLWTSDLDWGMHIIKKSRRLLLIPVFLSVAARDPRVVRDGLVAFVVSLALTAVVSLGVAWKLIPPFWHAAMNDPSPFVYHTSYAPELAWGAYVALAALLLGANFSGRWKCGLGAAAGLIVLALFVNIGVAGYIAFFMLFGLLFLQWSRNILWPVVAVILLVAGAYFISPSVHRRVNQNVTEVLRYKEGGARQENPERGHVTSSSLGPRLVFWENTWQIIKQVPVLGVGTGDFPAEYETVRAERTPAHWEDVNNPHNMYLMVWAQSGMIGLSVVLAFFGALLWRARQLSGLPAKLTVGLVCFFLLIMMSDAYLTLSNTGLLLVLFVAVQGPDIGEDRCRT